MKSAGTDSGIYLVIWLKNENFLQPSKYISENELNEAIKQNNPSTNNISIKIINCCKRISPSKR
jgi:hypothetical protein